MGTQHSSRQGAWFLVTEHRIAIVVPAGDGRTVRVVPGDPAPERAPDGTPMVTLLGARSSASLNVGVRWWPAEEELRRLLAAAAKRLGLPVSTLVVAADAMSDVRTSLHLIRDGERELVAADGSGAPPHTTVLTVQLSAAADIEAVRRALFGQAGVLVVRCRGESTVAGCITAQADVSGWTNAAPDVHVVMLGSHQ